MRLAAALALLAALARSAAAGTPAEEALRNEIEVLRAEVAPLRVSTAAPRLSGQLSDAISLLAAVAGEDPSRADAARRLQTRVASLKDAADRQAASNRPANGFYRGAAEQIRSIADDADALLGPSASAAITPRRTAASASAQARLDAGLRQAQDRIGARLGSAAAPAFDGASPAPLAAAPAPPPQELSRQASPSYSAALASDQTALNVVRRAEGLKRIAADGLFGPGTERAVKDFQGRYGLAPTGVIDPATESALIREFQSLKGLPATGTADAATRSALAAASRTQAGTNPGRYFQGTEADFDPTAAQSVIGGVLATVYTPYIDHSRREGGVHDRFMQTVCTLERFLAGRCPYVSVAIDSRLDVPDGTPLRIPGIDQIVGRPVPFRITDTGSLRLFHGTGHVDIATDSTQYFGYGSRISGREFTLVLPQGLHPAQP